MNFWNEPIQFLAREAEHVKRLSMRGEFFVPAALLELAQDHGVLDAIGLRGSVNRPFEVVPPAGTNPIVTTGYRDLLTAVRTHAKRPQIHLQHNDFKGAAHGRVDLFLCPDEARVAWAKKLWANKTAILMSDQAHVTAEAVVEYVNKRGNLRTVESVNGQSIGIIYMSFGEKAAQAIRASALSLRRIGLQIPVCVIGSTPVEGFDFIEWTGESPFDAREKKNFQFRAGRIKPKLYELSPFERTLYIDADTEFMSDILPAFEALDDYDVAIARENLTLHQLYNKAMAGWEINIKERDATVTELNAGPNVHFLNSGVLFFRKSKATANAMRRWHEAWLEWQQWDEQLAFMRGFFRTPEARVKILEPEWNYPHKHNGIVIFHNYGRGVVRMNVTPPPAPPQIEEHNLERGEMETA